MQVKAHEETSFTRLMSMPFPQPPDRTVFLDPPTDMRVHRGSTAMLACSFFKDSRLPDGQVVWRKDGHKVMQTDGDTK